MPDTDFEAPDAVPAGSPTVVGTPEGDNEFAPDQPLKPLPDEAEQEPRGGAPAACQIIAWRYLAVVGV